jgi:hypothetical protein
MTFMQNLIMTFNGAIVGGGSGRMNIGRVERDLAVVGAR